MFEFITKLIEQADSYNVNVYIFLFLFIGSIPFYYYSYYLLFKEVKNNKRIKFTKTTVNNLAINRVAWGAPYFYVLFFGKNLPIWVYVLSVIIIGLLFIKFSLKIKEKYGDNNN